MRIAQSLALSALLAAIAVVEAGTPAVLGPVPNVITRVLPRSEEETTALRVGTTEQWSTEIDLPYPVIDWRGRGFTPDPDHVAGDFMLDLDPGSQHFTISALGPSAHRVLHVELLAPDGKHLTYPIEFVPEAAETAPRRVTFVGWEPTPDVLPTGTPAAGPALPTSPRSIEALMGLMASLKALTPLEAGPVVATSPNLAYHVLHQAPCMLPEISILPVSAITDVSRGLTGLFVWLKNTGAKSILMDPLSWTITLPTGTVRVLAVDYTAWTKPGDEALVCLVVAPPLPLAAARALLVSAQVRDHRSQRPVETENLPPFSPP